LKKTSKTHGVTWRHKLAAKHPDLKKFYKFTTKLLSDLKLVCVPAINKVSTLIIGTKLTADGWKRRKNLKLVSNRFLCQAPTIEVRSNMDLTLVFFHDFL
jgi:hypothetical protein